MDCPAYIFQYTFTVIALVNPGKAQLHKYHPLKKKSAVNTPGYTAEGEQKI
jgi:hypothetical protein